MYFCTSGINSGAAPLYLAEIAPTSLRGFAGVFNQLAITTGVLVSQILGLDFVLGTECLWNYALGYFFRSLTLEIICLIYLRICTCFRKNESDNCHSEWVERCFLKIILRCYRNINSCNAVIAPLVSWISKVSNACHKGWGRGWKRWESKITYKRYLYCTRAVSTAPWTFCIMLNSLFHKWPTHCQWLWGITSFMHWLYISFETGAFIIRKFTQIRRY